MPYDENGIGYNNGSLTSYLAAQAQAGVKIIQKQKVLALFACNIGVQCDGVLGITNWHVAQHFPEMAKTSAWTARPAGMVNGKDKLDILTLELNGEKRYWVDPSGTPRELYFLKKEAEEYTLKMKTNIEEFIQPDLGLGDA
jgi:hypothetical protein